MLTHQTRGSLGSFRQVLVLVGIVALGLVSSAPAANLLTNGSFDSGTYTFGSDGAVALSPGSTAITGWTVITNVIAPISSSNVYSITPENGNVSLDLQGYTDTAPYGGVSQIVPTSPGTSYNLSFWVGVQNSIGYAVGPDSVTAKAGSTSITFTNDLTGPGNQWEQFNFDFTAANSTATISLSGNSTEGGSYIGLDNAILQANGAGPSTVPLPPAFWTALTFLVVLAITGRIKSAISKRQLV